MDSGSTNLGRLANKLAGLPKADRDTLVEQWQLAYGRRPPAGLSRLLLLLSLAYRLQEKSILSLKKDTSRILHRIATDSNAGVSVPAGLKPGTRLLREWNGVVHEAIILEKGILYAGKTYRSLTELAVFITGARWSGPRFFGLRQKGGPHE